MPVPDYIEVEDYLHTNFSTAAKTQTIKTIAKPFDIDSIDFRIVPREVMQSYLQGFNKAQIAEFEEAYAQVRDRAFAPFVRQMADGKKYETPSTATVVIGNAGSGKSHLIQRLKLNAVECSADEILTDIPSFQHAVKDAQSHASQHDQTSVWGYVREELTKATEKFRPAAQYMTGLLIQEAIENNLPVMAEITGKAKGTVELIENIKRTGTPVDGYICLTTDVIAAVACERRWNTFHPVSVSPEQVEENHGLILDNVPGIVASLNGNVTILARYGVNEPLKPVVHANATKYQLDADTLEKYNKTFGAKLAVGDLMASRKLVAMAEYKPQM